MGKGGGGGQTQQQQTSSSNTIPNWLSQAGQQAVSTAEDLSQRPYTPYTGEQVAPTQADTTQAYQQVRDMQGQMQPYYGQALGAYGTMAGQVNPLTAGGVNDVANQLYGNYQQQVMNPAQGLLGGYLQGGPATAQQVGSNAQALMSPYAQSVIDPATTLAKQQLAQNLQSIGAAANQAGAFGGDRQAVLEGQAQAQAATGLGQLAGNLYNQGWNQALTPAYNLASLGSQQGYNAASGLAGMGQTGYQNAAQYGQNLLGTNLSQGMAGAGGLITGATADQANMQQNAALMQTIGSAQQQQQQALDNAAMGNFYGQQNWPVQNLDILLSSLGAVPYNTSSTGTSYGQGMQQGGTNAAGQALSTVGTVAGIGASIATMI